MNYWIGSPQVLCDKVQSYLHLLRRAPPGWRPSVESPAHEQPDAARVRALVMYSSQRGGPQPPHEEATLAGTTCCVKGQGSARNTLKKPTEWKLALKYCNYQYKSNNACDTMAQSAGLIQCSIEALWCMKLRHGVNLTRCFLSITSWYHRMHLCEKSDVWCSVLMSLARFVNCIKSRKQPNPANDFHMPIIQ